MTAYDGTNVDLKPFFKKRWGKQNQELNMGLASKKNGMQKYSQLPHITQIYNMWVAQHFDVETEDEFFQPEVWNHCV